MFGACHAIKFNGKSRYLETDNICLDTFGKGSKRASGSQRGKDYGLFMGVLDFFNDRSTASRYISNRVGDELKLLFFILRK